MLDTIKADISAVRQRDPASRNTLEAILLYSGFHAVFGYRIAHFFYRHRLYFIARLLSQLFRFFTGIEIHPGAQIAKGLFIDHGTGVVIGETAILGENCTLYQGVTLGGTGKDHGKRHPTLGNNVLVGAGAKVLGPFTIGDNVKIAAGAVVLSAVEANSTAAGVPARVVRKNGAKVGYDMDMIHIPDPLSQEICRLRQRIEQLELKINQEKGEPTHESI